MELVKRVQLKGGEWSETSLITLILDPLDLISIIKKTNAPPYKLSQMFLNEDPLRMRARFC